MDHFKVRAMQAYVNIGANIEFRLSEARFRGNDFGVQRLCIAKVKISGWPGYARTG
jgi:hypothetical protein